MAEWQKNVQITNFTKNHDLLTTPVFAYIAFDQSFDQDSRRSGPIPRRDFGVTRLRLRKTCLETHL